MEETKNYPWHKNWPADVPKTVKYDDMLPIEHIRKTAKKFPNRTAIISHEAELTYKELNDSINYFSAGLDRLGVMKDDRVAIMLHNGIEFAIALYGILDIGAIAVLIDPTDSSALLKEKLYETEPEIVITHNALLLEHKDILMTKTVILVPDIQNSFWSFWEQVKSTVATTWYIITESINPVLYLHELLRKKLSFLGIKDKIYAEDTACIIYSSESKAIRLSHKDLAIGAQQTAEWAKTWYADRFLSIFPVFRSFGLSFCLNLPFSIGGSVVLIPKANIEHILETIQTKRPTILIGTSGIYEKLAYYKKLKNYDLSSLQFSYTIDRVSPEVQAKIKEIAQWELIEGYGLSEATTVQCCNIPKNPKVNSIGIPLPSVEMKIVSLDNYTIDLGPNEMGEVLIKSPSVMKNYWGIKHHANHIKNEWLHTSDVGMMDEDGYFFIFNKKRDLIRTKVGLIYPKEIEEVLNSHPDVVECAVVGVPKNGVDYIVALIKLVEGSDITPQELIGYSSLVLDKHKIPEYIKITEQLPRSETGRLMRRTLRALAAQEVKIEKED